MYESPNKRKAGPPLRIVPLFCSPCYYYYLSFFLFIHFLSSSGLFSFFFFLAPSSSTASVTEVAEHAGGARHGDGRQGGLRQGADQRRQGRVAAGNVFLAGILERLRVQLVDWGSDDVVDDDRGAEEAEEEEE